MSEELPTQIIVMKVVTYEVNDLVDEFNRDYDLPHSNKPSLGSVLEQLIEYLPEDFGSLYDLSVSDQDGEEITEWSKHI